MVGNVYYIGASEIASFLIATSGGLIVLDGGFAETAPLILANIRSLGFDPHDVRILLNSHAHYDHAGGLAELKKATGAQLYAGRGDSALLARGGRGDFFFGERLPFPPVVVDHAVADGDRVVLGEDTLVAIATPGHTRGCTTWSTTVRDRVPGTPRSSSAACPYLVIAYATIRPIPESSGITRRVSAGSRAFLATCSSCHADRSSVCPRKRSGPAAPRAGPLSSIRKAAAPTSTRPPATSATSFRAPNLAGCWRCRYTEGGVSQTAIRNEREGWII
jgi:hypothetical protein